MAILLSFPLSPAVLFLLRHSVVRDTVVTVTTEEWCGGLSSADKVRVAVLVAVVVAEEVGVEQTGVGVEAGSPLTFTIPLVSSGSVNK